eukprot:SAG31_NODE_7703_length_1613_cov_1.025760_2_plen_328_part_01
MTYVEILFLLPFIHFYFHLYIRIQIFGIPAAFWKHCCGYAAASGGLNAAPAQVTEHTAREVYIKPWRRARVAGARGLMPSHQTLLNIPCHANKWLLRGAIREELDWPLAYILSDTGDVAALTSFRVAVDEADAAAKALAAGVDVAQVDPCYTSLLQAIERGAVNESLVDAAVRRVLNHKFSVGLFDRPYVDETLAAKVVDSTQMKQLAYQAATESAVLLMNGPATTRGGVTGPLLPLPKDQRLRIAVVGPNGGCSNNAWELRPHWHANATAQRTPKMCEAALNMLGNYAEVVGPPDGVQTVHSALVASGYARQATFRKGASIDIRPTD